MLKIVTFVENFFQNQRVTICYPSVTVIFIQRISSYKYSEYSNNLKFICIICNFRRALYYTRQQIIFYNILVMFALSPFSIALVK